jgi:hypothetical protein
MRDYAMNTTTESNGIYWNELSHAISNTSRTQLLDWACTIPGLAGKAGWRRVTGFTQLAASLYRHSRNGLGSMAVAYEQERLGAYCVETANDFSNACSERATALSNLVQAIKDKPADVLPGLFFASLGFYTGGGGLDGNGGIPDLDIPLMGIGAHRSPLTHSIIAGIGFETLCLASLGMFTAVYYNLPDNHLPFWDNLHKQLEENGALFLLGGSAGIVYHLSVDTLVQPHPYHDLPFAMPIESHQTVMGLNALAEAGAAVKLRHFGRVSERFESFVKASQAARKTPGSKIRRNPDDNSFWLLYGSNDC